jgi:hypothetical protein
MKHWKQDWLDRCDAVNLIKCSLETAVSCEVSVSVSVYHCRDFAADTFQKPVLSQALALATGESQDSCLTVVN